MSSTNDSLSNKFEQSLTVFSEALHLSFSEIKVLGQSMVHSSYINDHLSEEMESNERLEFLGDAVLDYVVAKYLYSLFQGMTEGNLTVARVALVREETLARIARKLGVGDLLLLGQGEEITGGRDRDSNLAGALEALIGVISLDIGIESAEIFVLSILKDDIKNISINGLPKDPKSELQEVIQSDYRATPLYRVIDEFGPGHAKNFVVEVYINEDMILGQGNGTRKSDAERNSAINALANLGKR